MALNLRDKTSNANHLTNNGAAEYTADTPFAASTIAADLELDESDYLSAADSSSLSITSDLTIELWCKLEAHVTVGDHAFFVSKWDDSTQKSYWFRYRRNTLTVFQLQFGYYDGSADRTITVNMPSAPSTGTWRHFAVVFDAATSTAEFFVNASSIGSSSASGTSINDSTAEVLLGAWKSGGSATKFIDGIIDEVRIWNDKRSSTEISDNDDAELVGNEANLVAYWPFEDFSSASSSVSPSPSSSVSPSPSASVSPSSSLSPSPSPSPSSSVSASPSPSPSSSVSPSPSASVSPSSSISPSPSRSPSLSISLSPSSSVSSSASPGSSPSSSISSSVSRSPSLSISLSPSLSISRSPSLSPSLSPSPSPSRSPSLSISLSPSSSTSPSPSLSVSLSVSRSPSASVSASISPSPSPPVYVDKYSSVGNNYVDKYATQSNSYTDKYSTVGNNYTDKYSAQNNSYANKYDTQNTAYVPKYTDFDED